MFDVSNPTAPRLIREIPVGLEPVSVNPRTNDEAWVVNQLSDSVSIVSVSRGIVIDTFSIRDEPMDVVFAGVNQAYVSVSRTNAIAVFDTGDARPDAPAAAVRRKPARAGRQPGWDEGLCGLRAVGQRDHVIPHVLAPPPPPPTNPALPPAPQVAKIVSADDPAWSVVVKYRMPDNDVAIIAADASPVVGYYSRVGTVNLGLAVNPVNGDLFVANTTPATWCSSSRTSAGTGWTTA